MGRLKERQERSVVADPHGGFGLRPALCADVDRELRDRDRLFALLPLQKVDRLRADHAGHGAVHAHGAAGKHRRADAADGLEFQKAVFGDVRDDEAHLVHVRAEHQLFDGALFALLEGDDVAQRRDLHAVRQRLDLLQDQRADRVLLAGDADRRAELFQQFNIFHGSFLRPVGDVRRDQPRDVFHILEVADLGRRVHVALRH